jgi:hypothetical protein
MVANLSGVRQGERPIPNELIVKRLAKINERKADLNKALADVEKIALSKLGAKADSIISKPIAQWDFRKNDKDSQGNLTLKLEGNAKLTSKGLELDGKNSAARSSALKSDLKEKTLEAVVILSNLDQKGGGVITVETPNGTLFDSIVLTRPQPYPFHIAQSFSYSSIFAQLRLFLELISFIKS